MAVIPSSDSYVPSLSSPNSLQFAEPGDRFIPNRSLMNLDIARASLRREIKPESSDMASDLHVIPTAKEEYKRKLEENLTRDSVGKPFKILVFKGSPRSYGGRLRLVDEMMQQEQDESNAIKTLRRLPKSPDRILNAPNIMDDFYLNLMDWGKNNVLAVALGLSIYLWNAASGTVQELTDTYNYDAYPTSVAWSTDGRMLAVGLANSGLQLWDATSSRLVRSLEGHWDRVGSLAWNGDLLTSGSRDASIINHDDRASTSLASLLQVHSQEVCGLRWSSNGRHLASGSNDNLIHIWEASNMASSKYLHQFDGHHAAVKALAWCPYQSNVLASGGGTNDRCIKMWNIQTGRCISSLDTKAQVSALEWNRHQKEILSGQGFNQNQLCLWRYPSMSKIGELKGHTSRVLHLSQSPDGCTVVSAGADETLQFWKVFQPQQSAFPKTEDWESSSPLSLKRLHIR